MTILELYEPTFQYICRLNRLARAGATPDLAEVRNQVKSLLTKTKAAAAADTSLAVQHEKLELSLLFFIDFMVRNLKFPEAEQWPDLAAERGELAGDEKFFDEMDANLADKSESATQRLLFYYTCVGLGFSGWYSGQPEQLRKKMLACSQRLGAAVDADEASRICPDAYEHVNTTNLIEPPATSLFGIGIALVGLVLMLVMGNIYLYHDTSKSLSTTFDTVIKRSTPAGMGSSPQPLLDLSGQ